MICIFWTYDVSNEINARTKYFGRPKAKLSIFPSFVKKILKWIAWEIYECISEVTSREGVWYDL